MDGDRTDRDRLKANSLADRLHDQLRTDILTGHLAPGLKLQMKLLTERYGAGQTPLREALNRLSSEGLVDSRVQRGFFVKPVHLDELRELTKTRCWLETIALRESIANATPEWDEELIIAHHRLTRTPRSLDPDTFDSNPDWEPLHRDFHKTLISRCGSRQLLEFCEQLADRLYRYRMLSIQKVFTTRHVRDEHATMLQLALDRDATGAITALMHHYEQTAAAVLEDLKPIMHQDQP
ncbi:MULTISPECIES: GntR family transcriptional regulator [Pacificibacter]|uniref:GntR family transcriptional regulator n=1 Tax=Pacificibacter TaxID=1042323 RepID=UPI001C0A3262|nr:MULTISPECIES: GntR family transcriptional regulator [Pacificibacter]MBU2937383.1 GntR family transcriptional regulator [Pacificibacter marinus]MDO6617312.1 GntR family transcriptional regulator [Pacificibacter sp. 1_MG-2023]